eukprot:3793534-Prorocentrum_lima.AAC.1
MVQSAQNSTLNVIMAHSRTAMSCMYTYVHLDKTCAHARDDAAIWAYCYTCHVAMCAQLASYIAF